MRLIKIEDGLLEQDDFFKASSFSEFLGDFQYTRKDGLFTLTKGFIERRFEYDEYVILVEKENSFLNEEDGLYFYVRKDHYRSGLVEEKEEEKEGMSVSSASFWKIIRYEGFIQSYISSDGKDWTHKGGGEIKSTNVQGFQVRGNTPLVLKNYSVYRNPYLTVTGFTQGTIAVLLDEEDNIIKQSTFDGDGIAKMLLDYPLIGKLRFISRTGTLLYESELIYFKYGDIFSNTNYELELYYKGELVTYEPTILDTLKEIVILKNASQSSEYEDLYISTVTFNTDEVLISLDNSNYSEGVILPLIKPQEEVLLYIKIKKDKTKKNYGTRHFALEID